METVISGSLNQFRTKRIRYCDWTGEVLGLLVAGVEEDSTDPQFILCLSIRQTCWAAPSHSHRNLQFWPVPDSP